MKTPEQDQPRQPEIQPGKSPHIDIPQPDAPVPPSGPGENPVPVKG